MLNQVISILFIAFLSYCPLSNAQDNARPTPKQERPIIDLSPTTPSSVLTLGNAKIVKSPPEKYIVTAKDSLLEVAGHFIVDPLLAQELWGQNLPQVRPGDVVNLIMQGAQPALQIKRGRNVKLSPTMRMTGEERGIPTIPASKIQQFLNRPKIITEEDIEKSGYIIANSEDTLLTTTGSLVYARGLEPTVGEREFIVVRLGQIYHDIDSTEVLAREAIHIADAELRESGDPATLRITNAKREILKGDLILPLGERVFNQDYRPHVPRNLDGGRIIAVIDGVSQIGQYQVVVINKGTDDSMEVGHILAVNRSGRLVKDTNAGEIVGLPSQQSGRLMIFHVFEKVSYALVMKATMAINLFDEVTVP